MEQPRSETDYLIIHIFFEESFRFHRGKNLFDRTRAPKHTFHIKKSTKIPELFKLLRNIYNNRNLTLSTDLSTRDNFFDVIVYIDPDLSFYYGLTVEDFSECGSHAAVFLTHEQPKVDLILDLPCDLDSTELLFFKLYEPGGKRIYYRGLRYVPHSFTIAQLIPILNKMAGFSVETELWVYQEIEPGVCELIENVHVPILEVIRMTHLEPGEILVFQKRNEDTDNNDLPTYANYFREMKGNTVDVRFWDEDDDGSGFTLKLSMSTGYVEMAEALAWHLRMDPLLLQFTAPNSNHEGEKPKPWEFSGTINDIVSNSGSESSKKVYFRKLTHPPLEMENVRSLKVVWRGTQHFFYPEKSATAADLLQEVRNSPSLNRNGTRKLRLLEILSGNTPPSCVKEDALVGDLPHDIYKLEEIPEEEANVADNEILVPVVHSYTGYFSPEIPFFVKIKKNEPLSSIKEKIYEKLNIRDQVGTRELSIVHFAGPNQHSIVICHALESRLQGC